MAATLQVGLNVMLPDGTNINRVELRYGSLSVEQPFDLSHVIRKPGFRKIRTKTHIRL